LITIYKTLTNTVFRKNEYELLPKNNFPTTIELVGNKSAEQKEVAGIALNTGTVPTGL